MLYLSSSDKGANVFMRRLYSFLTAGITNCHNLSGLSQHKFILLQFWRPDVQNESYVAKIQTWAGLVPSGSSNGESIQLLLPAVGGC